MFQINAVFCCRGCLWGIWWWCFLNLISIQHQISPVQTLASFAGHHASLM
jgi:hypothetical protein